MEPFKTHRGIAVTLDTANIDTDQIIAKPLRFCAGTAHRVTMKHSYARCTDLIRGGANATF